MQTMIHYIHKDKDTAEVVRSEAIPSKGDAVVINGQHFSIQRREFHINPAEDVTLCITIVKIFLEDL